MQDQTRRIVGYGLLRLLADTLVLHYKVRHLGWRTGRPLDIDLNAIIRADHASLIATADHIAERIIALGVDVPPSLGALRVMSSITPEARQRGFVEAIGQVAQDHERIRQDVETLQVMLPVEDDPETVVLLGRLAEIHRCYRRRLGEPLGPGAARD